MGKITQKEEATQAKERMIRISSYFLLVSFLLANFWFVHYCFILVDFWFLDWCLMLGLGFRVFGVWYFVCSIWCFVV